MKKLLVICLTSLLALVVQAQNIMVVHPHNAAPQQFDVAVIDSMTWEDATTLHIYLHNQAAKDFAITHVDSLTWIVTSATEPPITIGEVQLGEGEAFIINDSLTEVRSSRIIGLLSDAEALTVCSITAAYSRSCSVSVPGTLRTPFPA